jgi:hypothetical protein
MTSHPTEVQFRVPPRGEEKTLFFLCSRCQEESINMCKTKVLGTKAGEKIIIEDDEQGDVDGVKDAIGDELEDIVLNHMLPKCGTCGVDFLAYEGNIAMVGSVKHHQECWETGKPGAIKPTDQKLYPFNLVAPSFIHNMTLHFRYQNKRMIRWISLVPGSLSISTRYSENRCICFETTQAISWNISIHPWH